MKFDQFDHPIELSYAFQENVLHARQDQFNADRGGEAMPYLAGLVAASEIAGNNTLPPGGSVMLLLKQHRRGGESGLDFYSDAFENISGTGKYSGLIACKQY